MVHQVAELVDAHTPCQLRVINLGRMVPNQNAGSSPALVTKSTIRGLAQSKIEQVVDSLERQAILMINKKYDWT